MLAPGADPLLLTHVPLQVWLLLCSLTTLVLGLGLTFLKLPRVLFWTVLAVLGLGALVTGLFWSGTLAAVLYGCQPGLVVLVPVLGCHWLLQRHYRRQVVFLPSFSRTKTPSGPSRGSPRPHGDPSTIDVPMGPLVNSAEPAPGGVRSEE